MPFTNLQDIHFWQTEGINAYRYPNGSPYHEGMEIVDTIVSTVGNKSMRDVGCGYGRLATKFSPDQYVGYDICQAAVNKGRRLFPTHKFLHWDLNHLPFADVTLFANGPWCVCDEDIVEMVSLICTNTNAVVFGEPMERSFRNTIVYVPSRLDHKVYPRNIETYDELLAAWGFRRVQTHVLGSDHWKYAYTVARWDAIG